MKLLYIVLGFVRDTRRHRLSSFALVPCVAIFFDVGAKRKKQSTMEIQDSAHLVFESLLKP